MPRSFINSALVALAVGAGLVNAAPVELASTAAPTLLSASAISAFTPYSWYASAGYCNPSATLAWNCGANCQGNPQFIPVASGGDGFVQQYWYVGYDPTFKSVIVSHQGTNPSNIIPLLTDGNFTLKNLDSTLFPGLSSTLQAHSGFLNSHALSAPSVLAAVQKTMSQYGTTSVTLTGHSLGAALALLDSVYLPLHLPSTTTFKTVGYGLPRVGNPAFAAFVDSTASKVHLTHINNEKDPVPILPGRGLGFAHPSGEVHIQSVGNWYSCPGEDNTSSTCEVGDVPNILVADLDNHDGPYGPVTMGCSEDN